MTSFPPGPKSRLRNALRIAKDPIHAHREWHATYGDTYHVPLLGADFVVTADAELARQIYANKDPELFGAGVTEQIEPLFGAQSILRLADERHNRTRKLMLPPFHGEAMRGWAHAIQAIARRTFPVGDASVRAMDYTQKTTLEVILRLVFGVHDDQRVGEFMHAIEVWSQAIDPLFIFVPALARDLLGLSPYAKYRKLSEQVDAMLYEQLAAVRAAPPTHDVLSMLIHARYDDGTGIDDVSLRDNLRTILFAGHDTTAITLAWALFLLHRHPEALARLRADLDALGPDAEPDTLARVPYLEAVIDETLRLRPINPETQRRLAKPWRFGEWELPAGTIVCISQLHLHYDARHWQRASEFVPERFLDQHPSPAVYSPFGGGNRRCLGATFARYEAAIVLGTLLRERSFEILDEEVEWGRGKLILEPLGGVRMRVAARDATPLAKAS